MLTLSSAERDETVVRSVEPSVPWALAGLSLCMLLASLGTSSANVALPMLAQTFTASFQEVQWVVLAYLLAVTTLIVSVGRLGDIIGRRQLLLAGIVVFTGASVLCGFAPTLGLLITARAAQGLGAAVMMALTMALVGETIAKAKTGGAMGLLGTMSAIGTALGPSLGGVLIAGLSWRAIFLVNVPLGILTFLLAHRHLPPDRRSAKTDRAAFDTAGTLLLALTLAAYALAVTIGHGRLGSVNMALVLAAAAGVGLFVLVEARSASPLIRLAMFRDPALSASLAMSALVSTVMMATLVVGPFYLARGLGLDAAVVGLVLSVGPIVTALTGVPAGRIADRFGAQSMIIVGLIAIAAGAFILSMLPATLGIAGYIAPIVVMTAGYALFQTANNTAVMTDIHPDQRGVISGLLNLSRNLGLITGASVMGAVFALASATTDITTTRPEAVASGMRFTFAVAAILMVVALAIAIGSRALATRLADCLVRVTPLPAVPTDPKSFEPALAGAQPHGMSASAARLRWVDHVRTFMILLVVNLHACVTASHVGDWYLLAEPEPPMAVKVWFILWQGHLQAFFMGLLFFLAGCFAENSLSRRGPRAFLLERGRRLGLPALLFMLVLHPFILLGLNPWHADFPPLAKFYLPYLTSGRFLSSSGPLWFALALLIFCVALAGWRLWRPSPPAVPTAPPNARKLWLFGLGLAAATFAIRLVQPIGTNVMNFQLCFFPQYIAAFAVGLAASRQGWLAALAASTAARRAGWLALVGGPLLLIGVMVAGGPISKEHNPYFGGWTAQALGLASWEQFTGLGLALGLLSWFSRRLDRTSPMLTWLGDRAFAVYTFHAPVLVALTMVFRSAGLNPFALAAVLTVTTLIATYVIADLARRIPGLRAIL